MTAPKLLPRMESAIDHARAMVGATPDASGLEPHRLASLPDFQRIEARDALWFAEVERLRALIDAAVCIHCGTVPLPTELETHWSKCLTHPARMGIEKVLDDSSGHLESCRRYVNGKGECDCILADLAKLIGMKPIGAKP